MKRDDFKRFGVCPRQHSAFCDGEFGRRDFLKSVIAALVAVAAAVGAVGQVVAADKPTAKVIPAEPLYHEALRPQFHFTARYWDDYNLNPGNDGREGWINDVNGLIYFDGEYHLFGQRWWHWWVTSTAENSSRSAARSDASGAGFSTPRRPGTTCRRATSGEFRSRGCAAASIPKCRSISSGASPAS